MDLFYGVDYHSHLGTRRGGMATHGTDGFCRSIHNIENSPFRTKFERDVEELTGNLGIGCISDYEPQPLLIQSHLGSFAITTVGKINNADELLNKIYENGHSHFQEMSGGQINATELVAALICKQDSFENGIRYAQEAIDGSLTLLIMTKDGIYAARDIYGRTPLVIGHREGAYCAAFENFSYINLGYTDVKELGPGEIVYITPESVETLVPPRKKMKICSFLWVYYGYPVSEYEGVNVDASRYASGVSMAKKDEVEADFVSGIPDSGIGMALGYAEGKGIPYRRAIVKYTPTWPRSFTPANQAVRDLVAKMKLIPNRELLRGKRVIFCDDSIVRGTQLRDNVNILYGYGAKEVHMRIGCPPILHSCPFVGFSASKSHLELIARRIVKEIEGDDAKDLDKYATTGTEQYNNLVERIREQLNITTLKFNTVEDLIQSIGLPKECVCTHCYDGSSCF